VGVRVRRLVGVRDMANSFLGQERLVGVRVGRFDSFRDMRLVGVRVGGNLWALEWAYLLGSVVGVRVGVAA